MIRFLLCDDEPDVTDALARVLREVCADECAVRAFQSAEAALSALTAGFRPDVVILDILLPGMTGVELAHALREDDFKGEIVFLTSAKDFGYESYRVRAMDYLLKPINPGEVGELVSRILSRRQSAARRIVIGKSRSARTVSLDELAYVEVNNHRLYFRMASGEVIVERANLSDYLDALLSHECMAQCHRSYVVNLNHVRSYASSEIHMSDGARIAITGKFADFHERCLEAMFGRED